MVVKYYLINDLDDMSLNCQPEINDLMSSYSFKQQALLNLKKCNFTVLP